MSRGTNTESGTAQGARRTTEASPDSARRGKGRWSVPREVPVVLELKRGAAPEVLGDGGDTDELARCVSARRPGWAPEPNRAAITVEHVKDWLAPRPTALTGEARIRHDERLRSRRIR